MGASGSGTSRRRFAVRVEVTPRAGIRDPEGAAIERALGSLGYPDVAGVHVGKLITLTVGAADPGEARRRVDEMCRRLLANPVIEDYRIEVPGDAATERVP